MNFYVTMLMTLVYKLYKIILLQYFNIIWP